MTLVEGHYEEKQEMHEDGNKRGERIRMTVDDFFPRGIVSFW